MKKYILIFILGIVAYGHANAQAIEEFFDKGSALYIHGKTVEAKTMVRAGLDKHPGNDQLIRLKKLLEEQSEDNKNKNQDQQNQDQNQDQQNKDQQNQDQKDQQDNQDQQNQDQNKDQQDQDQKDQQGQNPKDQEDQKDQQGQPQPQKISKEDAEQILKALQNDERGVKEKVDEQKKKGTTKRVDKQW